MDNDAKLKILIEAQNKAQKAFDDANSMIEKTEKNFSSMSDKLDKAGEKMKDVGSKMSTRLTLPILAGAGLATKAFSDLQETLSKVDVTFGENSGTIKSWADNAISSMGLAKQSALDAAALFGDMGTGMGQNRDQASKMSMSLTQLGADMASFKNVSFERAQTALAGVYTGETEALKGLGVVMTETNLQEFAASKGIQKKIGDMTQAEKVQLRYEYVMAQTANAQGDFARTSDSLANKTRTATEKTKELSAQFGEQLAPVMNKLLDVGTKVLEWFSKMSGDQQKMILMVIGAVAALGPLISIVGNLITAFKALQSVFMLLGANPMVLAFVATILLIAGLAYLIITNWETVKQWFSTFFEFVQGIFMGVLDFIKNNWEMIISIILGPLGIVIALVVTHFDTIKNAFMAVVNFIINGAQSVWNFLSNIFNGVKNFIVSAFRGAGDIVSSVWNGIKSFFSGFGDTIRSGVDKVKDIITSPFKAAFNAVSGFWNNTVGKLSFKAPDWVPGIGGKGFDMPKLPTLYKGVRDFKGGPAIVGDINGRGGEMVNLPGGTDVFTNQESKNIMRALADGQVGGGQNINMNNTFITKTEIDIQRFARDIGFQIARGGA